MKRTIEVDLRKAPLAKRMFELYASGRHSLSSLRQAILNEFGVRLAKGYLESFSKIRFIWASFVGRQNLPGHSHAACFPRRFSRRFKRCFRGHNKPKYSAHEFAFGAS